RVMRRALDGGVVQASSEQHQVAGYRAGPVPPGHVGIWVGGQRPRMLRVMGRVADGWISPLNIYVAPHEVPEKQEIIDEAATTAGRDPRDIRRIYNVLGAIGPFRGGQGLVGPVDEWVETLASWAVDLGFDTFVFWPITDAADQLRLFSDVVVPAVRDRVASLRSARGTALVDAGPRGAERDPVRPACIPAHPCRRAGGPPLGSAALDVHDGPRPEVGPSAAHA